MDDGIFTGPDSKEIDDLNASLKHDPKCRTSYDITDEGSLSDYLGVKIDQLEGGQMSLTQPHLIQQILNDLGFLETPRERKPQLSAQRCYIAMWTETTSKKSVIQIGCWKVEFSREIHER